MMNDKLLGVFRKMDTEKQIDILFSTVKSIRSDYKKFKNSSQKCLEFDGVYTGNGRGSSLYANMEKSKKLYMDGFDNLKVLIKEM